jgi:hypothetical protein
MTMQVASPVKESGMWASLVSMQNKTVQWTQTKLDGIYFAPNDTWKAHPYSKLQASPAVQGEAACRTLAIRKIGTRIRSTFRTTAFGKHNGRNACMIVVNLRFAYMSDAAIERAVVRLNFGTSNQTKASPTKLVPSNLRFAKQIGQSSLRGFNPAQSKLSLEINSQDLTTSYPRATPTFGPLDAFGDIKTEEHTVEEGINAGFSGFPSLNAKKAVKKSKEDRWHVQATNDDSVDRPCYTWKFHGISESAFERFPRMFMVGAVVECEEGEEFWCDVSVAAKQSRRGSDWEISIDRKTIVPVFKWEGCVLDESALLSVMKWTNLQAVPVQQAVAVPAATEKAPKTNATQTTTVHVEHQRVVQNLIQYQEVALKPAVQVVESGVVVEEVEEVEEVEAVPALPPRRPAVKEDIDAMMMF